MENREKFSSRLGFILISAGCAIGLGNVWRFPYITGEYGGGLFVLFYLFFLVAMGLPVIVMEYAIGRASQKSIAKSYEALEPKGSKWHLHKYFAIAGNYLLMMFYTTVGGWMLAYFVKMVQGKFVGLDKTEVNAVFDNLTSNRNEMIIWMLLISIVGFLICSFGLEKGVEKITKPMMLFLFLIMGVLVVRAAMLPGAKEGISFYLKPDLSKIKKEGIGEVIFAAMGQSFFTLSIGMGSLSIFGSYIGKERRLAGEAISVMVLDTVVAVVSGLIIFPACFSFDVPVNESVGLVFKTLPNIFNQMAGSRIWGALFFLFLTFAALSTIIAVFQNIIACTKELWGWSQRKATMVNAVIIIVLSLPSILGKTDWKHITIMGKDIMDFEDFLVSNNLLPLGAIVFILFCTTKYGWGWKNFTQEANMGRGTKFPTHIAYRIYLMVVVPLAILYLTIQAYITLLQPLFK